MLISKAVLSAEQLERLRQFDTCTLSNAIEQLNIRPRNEGFITGTAACRFPKLPPVIGYAVTGKIRTSMPPVGGRSYYERIDFWEYLCSVPAPRIVVLQDVDQPPGVGALFGEIHAHICRELACVAYVTNGAVRDVPGVEAMGFQLFAGSVSVSHAYAHIVEFAEPVDIGGLRIHSGDLLHGDSHGVLSIPGKGADKLVSIAEQVLAQDQDMFELTGNKEFSVKMLAAKLKNRVGR
jgi:regulator of RNase E activity RraA